MIFIYKVELIVADNCLLLKLLEKINFVEVLKKERLELYD